MLLTFLNVRTQPLPLPTTARTAVVFPILTPALATATATTISPKSQPEHETFNQANTTHTQIPHPPYQIPSLSSHMEQMEVIRMMKVLGLGVVPLAL